MSDLLNTLSIDGPTLVMICAVAFAAAVASGMSGMGGSMILSIVIAPLIGVEAIVPTLGVAMLIAHLARVLVYRREVVWPRAFLVTVAAVPSAIVGSMIYASLDTGSIAIAIGLFLIGSVPLRRYFQKHALRLNTPGLIACSAGFGAISGTTIGGGVIVIPILMAAGLFGIHLVATDAVIGLSVLVAKTVTYARFELIGLRLAILGLLVGLCMIPGTFVARWLVLRTGVRIHTLMMEALVVAGGILFLWEAVGGP